jgi:hypothetical protein
VLLWFVGLAVVIVWLVFRDTAIDYRLVAAGAIAPDVLDLPVGAGVMHTVAASAALLVVVMVATRGRRALRRRLLALPVGTFLHLVLDGAWADADVFWWPASGGSLGSSALPSVDRPLLALLVQEGVGLSALAWWWRRFRLNEPERRRAFARSGRLGRDLAT